MWIFPLKPSRSVAWVILYWLWVWQKTKKSRKEALQGREWVKFLLKVFLHLCVCIIWSLVSWLKETKTAFDWWRVVVASCLLTPKDVLKFDWLKYFHLKQTNRCCLFYPYDVCTVYIRVYMHALQLGFFFFINFDGTAPEAPYIILEVCIQFIV